MSIQNLNQNRIKFPCSSYNSFVSSILSWAWPRKLNQEKQGNSRLEAIGMAIYNHGWLENWRRQYIAAHLANNFKFTFLLTGFCELDNSLVWEASYPNSITTQAPTTLAALKTQVAISEIWDASRWVVSRKVPSTCSIQPCQTWKAQILLCLCTKARGRHSLPLQFGNANVNDYSWIARLHRPGMLSRWPRALEPRISEPLQALLVNFLIIWKCFAVQQHHQRELALLLCC